MAAAMLSYLPGTRRPASLKALTACFLSPLAKILIVLADARISMALYRDWGKHLGFSPCVLHMHCNYCLCPTLGASSPRIIPRASLSSKQTSFCCIDSVVPVVPLHLHPSLEKTGLSYHTKNMKALSTAIAASSQLV